jgi:hypothetical protein
MGEERVDGARPETVRWLVIAVVVIVGIALYLRLAPRTPAVLSPGAQEVAP